MKYFITSIFICLFATVNFAQSTKYFDAPFGGGGGFTPGWYIPNVDPLNLKLKVVGIPEFSKDGMFTTGGAGFIYVGFVKNLRIGGMGFSGTRSESASSSGTNYEATYSLGGGGLTVEYTLPFIKNIGVSLGGIVGGGSITIETFSNTSSLNWDKLFDNSSTNNLTRLSNSYWILTPTLNMEIPVYRFVALRIGLGYQFTLGGSWEANNGQSISGVPNNLNGNSFFIQTGIFAGFFSF